MRMFCSEIWKMNGIAPGPNLNLSGMPMFGPEDDRLTSSGLDRLIATWTPMVLHLNEPRLSAEMLSGALSRHVGARPQHLLIGNRALAGQMDVEQASGFMTQLGYVLPEDSPFATTILFSLSDAGSQTQTPGDPITNPVS